MLITPTSDLVRHRSSWFGAGSARLAQITGVTRTLHQSDPRGDLRACEDCCGLGMAVDIFPQTLADVVVLRPSAATAIDQCHLDVQSLHRRLAAIQALRPVESSRVAFVGDDDLASVALLHIAPPAHLLVVDVDERVLAVVTSEAVRLGLTDRVHTIHANLVDTESVAKLLASYGQSYDLVVSDPPYAEGGMRTFVAVATQLAVVTGEVHLAVPALLAEAWTDELLHVVQSDLLASGFVIDRVLPGAFTYETSDVISSLVIARRLTTSASRTPIVHAEDRFYTTRTQPARVGAATFEQESS